MKYPIHYRRMQADGKPGPFVKLELVLDPPINPDAPDREVELNRIFHAIRSRIAAHALVVGFNRKEVCQFGFEKPQPEAFSLLVDGAHAPPADS